MRYSTIALILLLLSQPAHGATIALRLVAPKLWTLAVQDKIEAGDLDVIKSLLINARAGHLRVIALELGSWGGDADTGMDIAKFVHDMRLRVVVVNTCTSACAYAALVALGNGKLAVKPSGTVGVHQVFDNGTREPDRPWTRRAAARLSALGAPRGPLEAMVDTMPSSMTYYSVDDLVGMGAIRLTDGWSW